MGGADGLNVTPQSFQPTSQFDRLANANSILNMTPKGLGISTKLSAIRDGTISAGGSILKGLGKLFRGGAYLVNILVMVVASIVFVAAHIPGAIVGGGVALFGGIIGGINGAINHDGKGRLKGAMAGAEAGSETGFKLGLNAVLYTADIPFLITRAASVGILGGIGCGLALLGGTKKDDVKAQMIDLFIISIYPEIVKLEADGLIKIHTRILMM